MTLVAFVVVIGVLIFVHEAGHFLAAKAVGVQVLRFSLGFGRPLLAWKRGETEYWISWLPIGGYVKMAGLEDEGIAGEVEGGKSATPVDPARAFDRKPLWARAVVMLAGVTMNGLFAFAVYTGLAYAGSLQPDSPATTQVDTVRLNELPAAAAPLAALRRGDRIIRVNGDSVTGWSDLLERLATAPNPVRLDVEGRPAPIVLDVPPTDTATRFVLARNLTVYLPPVIATVEPGSPAAKAGLQPGDRFLRVNGDTIQSWNDFYRVTRASPGKPLALTVERDGAPVELTVTPERRTDQDPVTRRPRVFGRIGVSQVNPAALVAGPFGPVRLGWRETVDKTGLVLSFLKKLFVGRASVGDLGGPITIAQVSGDAARLGLDVLLGFMAFLSINLAVLNLLPIPILDGGQLVFLIAEAVRRKPLSVALRTRLTQVGFVVIAGLMLLVIGNELLRLLQRVFS